MKIQHIRYSGGKRRRQDLQTMHVGLDEMFPKLLNASALACEQTRSTAEIQPNGTLGSKGTACTRTLPPPSLFCWSESHRIRSPPWPDPGIQALSTQVLPSFPLRNPVGCPCAVGCAASLPSRINPFTDHPVSSFSRDFTLSLLLDAFPSHRWPPDSAHAGLDFASTRRLHID